MGVRYWSNVNNDRMSRYAPKKKFTPRHVQILLRTYKTGAAAAFLTHTGDANVALREHYIKEEEEENEKSENDSEGKNVSEGSRRETYKYEKLKRAVEKIQEVKAAKTVALANNVSSY